MPILMLAWLVRAKEADGYERLGAGRALRSRQAAVRAYREIAAVENPADLSSIALSVHQAVEADVAMMDVDFLEEPPTA